MGDDWEHIEHNQYSPESYTWNNISDLASSVNGNYYTDKALGSYSQAYQKAKSYLPYLGHGGQAVHAGLSAAELGYNAYAAYMDM